MPHRRFIHAIVIPALLMLLPAASASGESRPSVNTYGTPGLVTVPTARMDETGTMRAGVSALDPYMHGFIGFQVAEPLYISLRQTMEVSGLNADPDRLYPGLDFKLRLAKEGRFMPAVSLGMNSAFGHRKTASEYIALSKRVGDFDLTGGIAWGRLGSAGHISNPFKIFSNHFDKSRRYFNEHPNKMDYWFTGPDVGLFAGVEYFTPVDGLSLQAEWGADRYVAERALPDYDTPAPWSVALNYAPADWIDMSLGAAGTEKIMGRLSFQTPVPKWPGRKSKSSEPVSVAAPRIPYEGPAERGRALHASAALTGLMPAAQEVGRAARHMANAAGPQVETLSLTPTRLGLKGPQLNLLRRDLESAASLNGSPEELWHSARFNTDADDEADRPDFSSAQPWDFRLILDTRLSLSEEDSGALYRLGLLIEEQKQWPHGLITGSALRINAKDNLDRLDKYRTVALVPVRSDASAYTRQAVTMERAYASWFKSLNTHTHLALTGGLLEEMYGGVGGELLVRPFGRAFAIGMEGWHVWKRHPESPMATNLDSQGTFTGHLNLWYEMPDSDLTFYGKVGHYLGEDFGITAGLHREFDNGARLKAFVTGTDEADADIFGGATNLYGGLQLSLPLGNVPLVPAGSEMRFTAAPFGRDTGQQLDVPLPLYEVTEPMSYRRLARSWKAVLN